MNKINIKELVRSNILQLSPYFTARDEFSGKAEVYLDANENPNNNGLNRYPDPRQLDLKRKIARIKGVDGNQVFLGNGSDEVLDVIMRSFCEPGRDNIIITPPTYGMYKILAQINNVTIKEALLNKDFSLNKASINAAIDKNTKAVILCSPNNPTGNLLDIKVIESLLNALKCLVVIDEAYIDFSNQVSWIQFLDTFPNLIVIQTFSKAKGLAGLRLGLCYSSIEINQVLQKVKLPYNLGTLTQQKALEYLNRVDFNEKGISEIIEERSHLSLLLKKLPFVLNVFPSETNFLLVQFKDANLVYRLLLERGIVVRNRSQEVLCDNCLRITVGTKVENRLLLNALSDIQ